MSELQIDISEKIYARGQGQPAFTALSNIHFTVGEGEFTCLVGPSGCGKTTLLNIISGLDTSFEGSVLIDGAPPSRGTAPGYMFQSPRLMPWLTVYDNIRLVLPEGDSESGIDQLLEEIGLIDFRNTFPGHLSGGMRRRVALARAMITEPRLLLLDEPFLSLDAPVANHLRRLLLDLYGRHPVTVVFVTHDIREALYLADRILFLSKGPGSVVFDLPVKIPRPRQPEGEAVEMLRLSLMDQYPQLLAGLIESETDNVTALQASSKVDQ